MDIFHIHLNLLSFIDIKISKQEKEKFSKGELEFRKKSVYLKPFSSKKLYKLSYQSKLVSKKINKSKCSQIIQNTEIFSYIMIFIISHYYLFNMELISFKDFSEKSIKLFFFEKKKYNFKEYFDFVYEVTELNTKFFEKTSKVILYLSILCYCLDMFIYECKLTINKSLFSILVIYYKCEERKIISVSKKISAMEENYSCKSESNFKFREL